MLTESKPATLGEALRQTAEPLADAPAIVARGRSPLPYGALVAQVDAVARALRGAGTRPDDRVAVVIPNGPEMAVAFLGVATTCTCAPLNPAYTLREFEFYLRDLKARLLVVPQGCDTPARAAATALGAAVLEFRVGERAGELAFPEAGAGRAAPTEAAIVPDHTALVLHTSGTTARPKKVPISHRQLCLSAENVANTLRLTRDDRCLNVMPLFHIHGLVAGLLAPLLSGGSVVCTPGFHEESFFASIDELAPSWYTAVPTIHQAVLKAAPRYATTIAKRALRLIRSSSASLPASVMHDLEETFGVPVIEAYGMTEAAHQMASNRLPPGARKPRSVGPSGGPEIGIMDERGNLLRGESGEIVVRGPSIFAGYETDGGRDKSAFAGEWFRTGDRGHVDDDGYLFISGRIKELINRAGEKVSPYEVEEVLLAHPGVAQAAAFADAHPTLGEDVMAAVVPRAGAAVTADELRQLAVTRLAAHKVPQQILIVPEIPKGPTGKVQRVSLAEVFRNRLAAPFVEPRDDVEKALAAIWADVLGQPRIGIHDNFFRLGGDSLQSGVITARARRANLVVDATQFTEHPTIAELRPLVRHAAQASSPAERTTGDCPLFPLQRFVLRELRGAYLMWTLEATQPIDERRLEEVVQRLVDHHDGLRARFSDEDRGWRSTIAPPGTAAPPARIDLSKHAESEVAPAYVAALRTIVESMDLRRGPLVRFVHVTLPGTAGVAIIAHHAVVDYYSLRILAEDLQAAYDQSARGARVELPAKTTSLVTWGEHQWSRLVGGALDDELGYWRALVERLPKLPSDGDGQARGAFAPLMLDPEASRRLLREIPSANGVQTADIIAAALVNAVADWTGERTVGVLWTLTGRANLPPGMDLSRTVGCLVSWAPTVHTVDAALPAFPGSAQELLRAHPAAGTNFAWLAEFRDQPLLGERMSEMVQFDYIGALSRASRDTSSTLRMDYWSAFGAQTMNALAAAAPVAGAHLTLATWVFREQLLNLCLYDASRWKASTMSGLVERLSRSLLDVQSGFGT